MKRLLTAILLFSVLLLVSCSNSNAKYVDDIVGTWHTELTLDKNVDRQYVFRDDFTGKYTFFAYTVYEEEIEEQTGEFTWSYDENAKVYLIYIGSSTPQVARISTKNDTPEISISEFHIGIKTE